MRRLMLVLGLAASLLAGEAGAATYWISGFNPADGNLNATWGTSSCQFNYAATNPPGWPNGCNPRIDTTRFFEGTASLLKDYTEPIKPDGANPNSGPRGAYISRGQPQGTDLWVSFLSRIEGYAPCDQTSCIDKIHYNYFPDGQNGPSFVLAFYFGTQLAVLSQGESSATAPCNTATAPGPSLSCNYTANMNTGLAQHPQNQWVCIEEHYRANSLVGGVAQNDGVVEVFIDSTQILGYYDRRWSGVGQPYYSTVGGLQRIFTQSGKGKHWIDRYATGNTRQGCSGSGGGGGSTTPPLPAAPTEIHVTELMKTLEELSKALLAALKTVAHDAQALLAWLGPNEAAAETAKADQVTITWKNPDNLEAGAQIELSLTAFWLAAADQGKVIGLLKATDPALVYTVIGADPAATDRFVCVKARYKGAGGYGPYGEPGCNQLAKPVVIPPPPPPPPPPVVSQAFTNVRNSDGVLAFDYDQAVCKTSPYVSKATTSTKGSTKKTITMTCVR